MQTSREKFAKRVTVGGGPTRLSDGQWVGFAAAIALLLGLGRGICEVGTVGGAAPEASGTAIAGQRLIFLNLKVLSFRELSGVGQVRGMACKIMSIQ